MCWGACSKNKMKSARSETLNRKAKIKGSMFVGRFAVSLGKF